jgi:hypothetical protein
MTTTVLPGFGLTLDEREHLRDSLSRRREELRTALHLYEEARISEAPRAALARRTRAAIAEIDVALGVMHNTRYGICAGCRRPLPLNSLTRRPLDMLCRSCEI